MTIPERTPRLPREHEVGQTAAIPRLAPPAPPPVRAGARLRLLAALTVATLCCCGGATSAARSTGSGKIPGGKRGKGAESTARGASGGEPSLASRCNDGTCSPCGDGICPRGYYCDEGGDGAACAWLPACLPDASCACVQGVLGASCRCEERGGSVHVRCP